MRRRHARRFAQLSPVFRVLLVVEMALIYVGAPLAVSMAVHDLRLPVFIALLPVLGIVLICLLVDPDVLH